MVLYVSLILNYNHREFFLDSDSIRESLLSFKYGPVDLGRIPVSGSLIGTDSNS